MVTLKQHAIELARGYQFAEPQGRVTLQDGTELNITYQRVISEETLLAALCGPMGRVMPSGVSFAWFGIDLGREVTA